MKGSVKYRSPIGLFPNSTIYFVRPHAYGSSPALGGNEAGTPTKVTALRRAIIGQESGGKFNIVNPHSGALGYAQLMEYNVAPWTKAALGREVSTSEFLNSRDIQIKTIDHKIGQYLERELRVTGGNEEIAIRRVASTWYSGNPRLYTSTRTQYYNGHPYPSIAEYSSKVWTKYQAELQK
jgi:hypothetical protein